MCNTADDMRYFIIDNENHLHYDVYNEDIQTIIECIWECIPDEYVFPVEKYTELNEADSVLLNDSWYNYGVLTPNRNYTDWSYIEAYDVRNGEQDVYVFVNTEPTGEMLYEIRSSKGDFYTVIEKDDKINDIVSIWENMDITNQYDAFLDFTRYLYHRYLDNINDTELRATFQELHDFCKELIATHVISSLNDKMRRCVFVNGDNMSIADMAIQKTCSIEILHNAFCDYADTHDAELEQRIAYKHCKLSDVDMLIRSGRVYDIVKIPENCTLGYSQIMQSIYDARSPEYAPVDPDDEDSNWYPVYKNPNDIIPGIK